MPDMSHHDQKDDHGKAEQPCPFSSLSTPSRATADSILLGLAVAFIIFTFFWRPALPFANAPDYLRPPLREPMARS
jgi:hypothetical protein